MLHIYDGGDVGPLSPVFGLYYYGINGPTSPSIFYNKGPDSLLFPLSQIVTQVRPQAMPPEKKLGLPSIAALITLRWFTAS